MNEVLKKAYAYVNLPIPSDDDYVPDREDESKVYNQYRRRNTLIAVHVMSEGNPKTLRTLVRLATLYSDKFDDMVGIMLASGYTAKEIDTPPFDELVRILLSAVELGDLYERCERFSNHLMKLGEEEFGRCVRETFSENPCADEFSETMLTLYGSRERCMKFVYVLESWKHEDHSLMNFVNERAKIFLKAKHREDSDKWEHFSYCMASFFGCTSHPMPKI